MIDFTLAAPADAPLLGQLRQQCWAAAYRGVYPDEMIDGFDFPWHLKRDLARIGHPQFDVRIIREEGRAIGYMTIRDGAPPLLYSLYLLPEHQRRGVGRMAMERMRAWCRERGHACFLCHCQPQNAPAMAFYQRMGGVIISREEVPEARWQDTATFRFAVEARRCRWCDPANPRYAAYHDEEWGVLREDDPYLFEMLLLESFQAGLSWACVLNKREAFRAAFDGFDWHRIAAYDEDKVAALLADPGIIRNRLKVRAAIRNAQVFEAIRQEFGSFAGYLHTFTGGQVIIEHGPVTSPLSDALSRDLMKRGMRFVGSTILYSFLQAVGVIDGHDPGCAFYRGK